ncbi:MAG: hypothetical protein V3U72_04605 [Candidatus Aenigmarchaeota archaeon]
MKKLPYRTNLNEYLSTAVKLLAEPKFNIYLGDGSVLKNHYYSGSHDDGDLVFNNKSGKTFVSSDFIRKIEIVGKIRIISFEPFSFFERKNKVIYPEPS